MKLKYYYCVETTTGEKIWMHADRVRVADDGSLLFESLQADANGVLQFKQTLFALAPGQWVNMFAAHLLDGSACTVEHWDKPKAPPNLFDVEKASG